MKIKTKYGNFDVFLCPCCSRKNYILDTNFQQLWKLYVGNIKVVVD